MGNSGSSRRRVPPSPQSSPEAPQPPAEEPLHISSQSQALPSTSVTRPSAAYIVSMSHSGSSPRGLLFPPQPGTQVAPKPQVEEPLRMRSLAEVKTNTPAEDAFQMKSLSEALPAMDAPKQVDVVQLIRKAKPECAQPGQPIVQGEISCQQKLPVCTECGKDCKTDRTKSCTAEKEENSSYNDIAIQPTQTVSQDEHSLQHKLPVCTQCGKVCKTASNGSCITKTEEHSSTHSTLPIRPHRSANFKENAINHLEAYTLRPEGDTFISSAEWSYRIDYLPIDTVVIQKHVDKLGPEHSVIENLHELQADQCHAIKDYVDLRDGKLVSAKKGKMVVTKQFATPRTNVLFILSTARGLGEGYDLTQKAQSSSSGEEGILGAVGLTAQRPVADRPSSAGPSGSFSGNKMVSALPFRIFNPQMNLSVLCTNGRFDVKAYRLEQGQGMVLCSQVMEDVYDGSRTPGPGPKRLFSYQLLPLYIKGSLSFEELRLADLVSGYRGLGKIPGKDGLFKADPPSHGAGLTTTDPMNVCQLSVPKTATNASSLFGRSTHPEVALVGKDVPLAGDSSSGSGIHSTASFKHMSAVANAPQVTRLKHSLDLDGPVKGPALFSTSSIVNPEESTGCVAGDDGKFTATGSKSILNASKSEAPSYGPVDSSATSNENLTQNSSSAGASAHTTAGSLSKDASLKRTPLFSEDPAPASNKKFSSPQNSALFESLVSPTASDYVPGKTSLFGGPLFRGGSLSPQHEQSFSGPSGSKPLFGTAPGQIKPYDVQNPDKNLTQFHQGGSKAESDGHLKSKTASYSGKERSNPSLYGNPSSQDYETGESSSSVAGLSRQTNPFILTRDTSTQTPWEDDPDAIPVSEKAAEKPPKKTSYDTIKELTKLLHCDGSCQRTRLRPCAQCRYQLAKRPAKREGKRKKKAKATTEAEEPEGAASG